MNNNTNTPTIPQLKEGIYDQAFDEIELLGFPLSSPFDLISEKPDKMILTRQLSAHWGKIIHILGYFVARKHVTTVRIEHMNFGI